MRTKAQKLAIYRATLDRYLREGNPRAAIQKALLARMEAEKPKGKRK